MYIRSIFIDAADTVPTDSIRSTNGVIATAGMFVVIAVPNETPSTENATEEAAAFITICRLWYPVVTATEEFVVVRVLAEADL